MRSSRLLLLSLLGVLLLVGVAFASGLLPGSGGDSARPPCEQLPAEAAVSEAVASHQDLVRRLREVGPGVRLSVATPCDGQPGRALVRILYATTSERSGVDALLQQDGFGVPVELVGD